MLLRPFVITCMHNKAAEWITCVQERGVGLLSCASLAVMLRPLFAMQADRERKKLRKVCALGKCEPTNSSRLYLGAEHQNSFSMTGQIRKWALSTSIYRAGRGPRRTQLHLGRWPCKLCNAFRQRGVHVIYEQQEVMHVNHMRAQFPHFSLVERCRLCHEAVEPHAVIKTLVCPFIKCESPIKYESYVCVFPCLFNACIWSTQKLRSRYFLKRMPLCLSKLWLSIFIQINDYMHKFYQ